MSGGVIENLVGSIIGGLAQAASSIAGKALVGLGFGIAVFSGYDATMSWMLGQAVDNFKSLPTEVAQVLHTVKIDSAISMIGSAFTVKIFLKGLSPTGALSRWVMKG